MPFPQGDLQQGEEVVTQTRPHWLQVAGAFVWLMLSSVAVVVGTILTLVFAARYDGPASVALLAGGLTFMLVLLVSALVAWRKVLYWWFTRYVVTNRRLILRYGILRQYKRDIPLRRVQDVHLDQGILARLVHAGDLAIETAGKASAIPLVWTPAAEQMRSTVHRLARASRQEEGVDPDEGL